MSDLEKASIEAWNRRLFNELEKPRLEKARKQARKARQQARWRKELLEGLHASASRAFTPKIVRRPAKLASVMQSPASENASSNKLDSISS